MVLYKHQNNMKRRTTAYLSLSLSKDFKIDTHDLLSHIIDIPTSEQYASSFLWLISSVQFLYMYITLFWQSWKPPRYIYQWTLVANHILDTWYTWTINKSFLIVYISIGLGTGFLICRMVDPDSAGLKGACFP